MCQYRDGEEVYSEDIKANIYLLEVPSSPVLVGDLVEGEAASLSLTAGLYPAPEKILWTVKDLAGAVETVAPGGEVGRYRAAPLEVEVRLGPTSHLLYYVISLCSLAGRTITGSLSTFLTWTKRKWARLTRSQ